MDKNQLGKGIVDKINSEYGIQINDTTLLREGSDNLVFVARLPQKNKCIIRLSKRDVREDVIFETTWLEYLIERDFPAVECIKTLDGKPFLIIDKTVLVLFKFVHGRSVKIDDNTKPELGKVRKAAKQLAKLHSITRKANISLPRSRNLLTEIARALEFQDEFISKAEGGADFVNQLRRYSDWISQHNDKECLLHNDYRVGNVFFEGDNVSTILDFDWACMGPALKDVAHAIVEWSFPDGAERHWQDVFDAFIDGYNSETEKPVSAGKELYNWMCFACLSDAATYLTDLAVEGVFKRIAGSYMYKKFLYFQELADKAA